MNFYDKGDLVRVTAAFSNAAGAAVDPTTVRFKFKNPAAVVVTYTYGTDAQLVKDSVGNYHVDVDANAISFWYWRWESTGSGQSAEEGFFNVRDTYF